MFDGTPKKFETIFFAIRFSSICGRKSWINQLAILSTIAVRTGSDSSIQAVCLFVGVKMLLFVMLMREMGGKGRVRNDPL